MSIRLKLMGMLMGVCAAALVLACVSFVAYDSSSSKELKFRNMSVLSEAIADAAYGPSAFEDAESAKTVLSTLDSEPTAERAALYVEGGKRLLAGWGDAAKLPEAVPDGAESGYEETSLTIVQPVEKDGTQVGLLWVELSTEDLRARTEAFFGIAIKVLLGALFLAFVTVMFLHRIISHPVNELASAARQVRETADYSLRAKKVSSDELGMLTDAFNEMLASAEQRERELEEYQHGLEEKVAQRTAALDAKNREMTAILDNVDQGFAMVEPDGALAEGRSAAFDRWFGAPEPGRSFAEHMQASSVAFAEWFALGLDEVVNGFLPREISLSQLPNSFEHQGRSYSFDYKPLLDGEDVQKLLVVSNDVTEKLRREGEEAKQREYAQIFDHFVKDGAGLLEFYDEAKALMEKVMDPVFRQDFDQLKRAVHTVKGNCSLYGVESVAAIAHELETSMAESGALPSDEALDHLHEAWVAVADQVHKMVGRKREMVEVPIAIHQELVDALRGGLSADEGAKKLESWRHEAMTQRLDRVAAQVKALAKRMQKGTVDVQIMDNAVRLPPERWAPFWAAFAHVVRNAVDHGLEAKADKLARGDLEPPPNHPHHDRSGRRDSGGDRGQRPGHLVGAGRGESEGDGHRRRHHPGLEGGPVQRRSIDPDHGQRDLGPRRRHGRRPRSSRSHGRSDRDRVQTRRRYPLRLRGSRRAPPRRRLS